MLFWASFNARSKRGFRAPSAPAMKAPPIATKMIPGMGAFDRTIISPMKQKIDPNAINLVCLFEAELEGVPGLVLVFGPEDLPEYWRL